MQRSVPARRKSPDVDDGALPVMVPRNERPLVPVSPDRVDHLRAHLARVLPGLPVDSPQAVRPGPEGFGARVAQTACSMCKGWCCRNGADDAYLDEATLARSGIGLSAIALLRLYVERVPEVAYQGSCIFHGKAGCTLDRSMRSDVCNAHFCGGLHAYLTGGDAPEPTVVIAGEGAGMRTSPVLIP